VVNRFVNGKGEFKEPRITLTQKNYFISLKVVTEMGGWGK
jgi:hypothetical protein